MATRILIPTPLRPFTDKQDAVEAEGKTIGELLADLTAKHAGLKAHLYNEQGKLRSFVNVYVNDEDIRYLQKDQTPVSPSDTVSIIPSVAGGVEVAEDARSVRLSAERTADADERRSEAVLAAPHHAGGRCRRAAQAEGGQSALHRRRRARIASGAVPRRRRRRHGSGSSISMTSTSATCSGRFCTAPPTSAVRSWSRRRRSCTR